MDSEGKSFSYLKYLLALLLFGFNGIVASYILLSSYEIVFLRTLIASIFLGIILFFSKRKPRQQKMNHRHLVYLLSSGIAMGASWMLLYEAYTEIGVSIATLAYYCGPVIVMLFSPLIFRERLTIPKILGFIVVLAGMYLVNGSALQQGGISRGLLFGILSALTYAVMVVFNKKATSITGLENATLQLLFSFITVAIFLQLKQGLVISGLMQNIIPVLILGIINTGVGCYLYFSSIQQLSAGSVAICGYLEPLSALAFSALFLSERLLPLQILGAVFIIGGAAVGELLGNRKYYHAYSRD